MWDAACGSFLLIGAALGEQAKRVELLSRYDYSSLAMQGYLDGPVDMEMENVAVVALDDLVEGGFFPNEIQIDILKLDAEGYEMGVLRGWERALRDNRIHWLIFEYQPAMLATTGTDHEGLLHFLAHYGFICYSLKLPGSGMRPMDYKDFAAQYTENTRLKLRGMGAIEDIMCENRYFKRAVEIMPHD